MKVKFTRNPKYTPATLTAHELSRIENLVIALFNREVENGEIIGANEAMKNFFSFSKVWSFDVIEHPEYGMVEDSKKVAARSSAHASRWSWLKSPAAKKYFSNCWNYVSVIAIRTSKAHEPEKLSKSQYAQIYGY